MFKFFILVVILVVLPAGTMGMDAPEACDHNCTNAGKVCASSKAECKYFQTHDYKCTGINTYPNKDCPEGYTC